MNRRLLLLALATLPLLSSAALADGLPAPTGDEILEITGKIANTNADGAADFDMAMLAALPQRTTVTTSPWYDGKQTFAGPLGWALLNQIGATGTTLKVTALNDYVTEIPVGDFKDYQVILATSLNGEAMSVRDKGPIFIIYPFDEKPELYNQKYFSRSVWQIKEIDVTQ